MRDDRQEFTARHPVGKASVAGTADFAKGGGVLTGRSQFMKAPDQFRTDTQRQDYGGKDPLAKASGDTKSKTPIKPRS